MAAYVLQASYFDDYHSATELPENLTGRTSNQQIFKIFGFSDFGVLGTNQSWVGIVSACTHLLLNILHCMHSATCEHTTAAHEHIWMVRQYDKFKKASA